MMRRQVPNIALGSSLILFSACLKTSDDIRAKDDASQAGDISQVFTEYTEWCQANDCAQLQWSKLKEGTFQMGKSGDDPNHSRLESVTVGPLELLTSEVTVGQYRACVTLGVCNAPSACDEGEGSWTEEPGLSEGLPMSCVTFQEAELFAGWAGGRLPTEAEWEYAARSEGIEGLYPWGERPPTCAFTNFLSCIQSPSPICQLTDGHSHQGVCDLTGNLMEWVSVLDEQKPVGLESFKVGKGGSWAHSIDALTASYRHYLQPNARLTFMGFRVVK